MLQQPVASFSKTGLISGIYGLVAKVRSMRPFAGLPFTLLVGCSSPYQFSNEIGSFSTGVDNVASAYTAGYSSLFSDRLTYRTLIFNDTSAKLKLAISCSPAAPPSELPCEFYPQGAPQPSPSDPKLESDRRGSWTSSMCLRITRMRSRPS